MTQPTPMVTVTADQIIEEARGLHSETDENPEYDRALVELTMRLLGYTEDARPLVEFMLHPNE